MPSIVKRYDSIENLTEFQITSLRKDIYSISKAQCNIWGLGKLSEEKTGFKGSYTTALQAVFPKLHLNLLGFRLDWSTREKAIESIRYMLNKKAPELMNKYNNVDLLSAEEIKELQAEFLNISTVHLEAWDLIAAINKRNTPYFNGRVRDVLLAVFDNPKLGLKKAFDHEDNIHHLSAQVKEGLVLVEDEDKELYEKLNGETITFSASKDGEITFTDGEQKEALEEALGIDASSRDGFYKLLSQRIRERGHLEGKATFAGTYTLYFGDQESCSETDVEAYSTLFGNHVKDSKFYCNIRGFLKLKKQYRQALFITGITHEMVHELLPVRNQQGKKKRTLLEQALTIEDAALLFSLVDDPLDFLNSFTRIIDGELVTQLIVLKNREKELQELLQLLSNTYSTSMEQLSSDTKEHLREFIDQIRELITQKQFYLVGADISGLKRLFDEESLFNLKAFLILKHLYQLLRFDYQSNEVTEEIRESIRDYKRYYLNTSAPQVNDPRSFTIGLLRGRIDSDGVTVKLPKSYDRLTEIIDRLYQLKLSLIEHEDDYLFGGDKTKEYLLLDTILILLSLNINYELLFSKVVEDELSLEEESTAFSLPADELVRTLRHDLERVELFLDSVHEAITVFCASRIPVDSEDYNSAVELGRAFYRHGFIPRTGAGPGIMEAVPRGYIEERESDGKRFPQTQGVKIPITRQDPNKYIEELLLVSHFIPRKIPLMTNRIIATKGGFGTLDELFDAWRMRRDIVLFDEPFWQPLLDTLYAAWEHKGIMKGEDFYKPFCTSDIDEVIAHFKEERYKGKIRVQDIGHTIKEIERTINEVRHLPPAVQILGSASINVDKTAKELRIAEETAEWLSSHNIALRVGGEGPVTDAVIRGVDASGNGGFLQGGFIARKVTQEFLEEFEKKGTFVMTDDMMAHKLLLTENSLAYVFLPGAIGTIDALTDVLNLMQTGKMPEKPLLLVGKEFWQPIVDMVLEKMNDSSLPLIGEGKEKLLMVVDSMDEVKSALQSIVSTESEVQESTDQKLYSLKEWRKQYGTDWDKIFALFREIDFFSDEREEDELRNIIDKLGLEPGQKYLHVGGAVKGVVIFLSLVGVDCVFIDKEKEAIQIIEVFQKKICEKLHITEKLPLRIIQTNIDKVLLDEGVLANEIDSFDVISMFNLYFLFIGNVSTSIENILRLVKHNGVLWFTPRTILQSSGRPTDLSKRFEQVAQERLIGKQILLKDLKEKNELETGYVDLSPNNGFRVIKEEKGISKSLDITRFNKTITVQAINELKDTVLFNKTVQLFTTNDSLWNTFSTMRFVIMSQMDVVSEKNKNISYLRKKYSTKRDTVTVYIGEYFLSYLLEHKQEFLVELLATILSDKNKGLLSEKQKKDLRQTIAKMKATLLLEREEGNNVAEIIAHISRPIETMKFKSVEVGGQDLGMLFEELIDEIHKKLALQIREEQGLLEEIEVLRRWYVEHKKTGPILPVTDRLFQRILGIEKSDEEEKDGLFFQKRTEDDGYIQQGKKSREVFENAITEIRMNDITGEYREKISSLLQGFITHMSVWEELTDEEKVNVTTLLKRYKKEASTIYGYHAIIIGENDFHAGEFKSDTNEFFLAQDVIENLRERGPPSLLDEYILHEIICPLVGHYRAIILQQKFFPEHYIKGQFSQKEGIKYIIGYEGQGDKLFKGLLGEVLRSIISGTRIKDFLHYLFFYDGNALTLEEFLIDIERDTTNNFPVALNENQKKAFLQELLESPECISKTEDYSIAALRFVGNLRAMGVMKNRSDLDGETPLLGNLYFKGEHKISGNSVLRFRYPQTQEITYVTMVPHANDNKTIEFRVFLNKATGFVYIGRAIGVCLSGDLTIYGDVPTELVEVLKIFSTHLPQAAVEKYSEPQNLAKFVPGKPLADWTTLLYYNFVKPGIIDNSHYFEIEYFFEDKVSEIPGKIMIINHSSAVVEKYNVALHAGVSVDWLHQRDTFLPEEKQLYFKNAWGNFGLTPYQAYPFFHYFAGIGKIGEKVLDLGGGKKPLIAKLYPHKKVVSIDVGSPEWIAQKNNVLYVEGNVEDSTSITPLMCEQIAEFLGANREEVLENMYAPFDTIVLSHLLNYVDAKKLIEQVKNNSRPGASIIIQNGVFLGENAAFSPHGVKTNEELLSLFDPRYFELVSLWGFPLKKDPDSPVPVVSEKKLLQQISIEKARKLEGILYIVLEKKEIKEDSDVRYLEHVDEPIGLWGRFVNTIKEGIVESKTKYLKKPENGFIISEKITSIEGAWNALFSNQKTAQKFFKLVSFLRKQYPFDMTKFTSKAPLEYAMEEGIIFQIGPNLYTTPITESFRRHIIFAKNDNGQILFAFEVLIPGDTVVTRNVTTDIRSEVAQKILSVFPEKDYCVTPLFLKEFPDGVYELYGEQVAFNSTTPLRIMAFSYTDGKRLDFLSPIQFSRIAEKLGILAEEVEMRVAEQVAELTAAVHIAGYIGNNSKNGRSRTDLHLGNFRCIIRDKGIHIQLVGDFDSFIDKNVVDFPTEGMLEDSNNIIDGVHRISGLTSILIIDKERIYEIFGRVYKRILNRFSNKRKRDQFDGFIRQGTLSTETFKKHIPQIRGNDITHDYSNTIVSLLEEFLRKESRLLSNDEIQKLETWLQRYKRGEIKVYGYHSIVKGENDFHLGEFKDDTDEIFLAQDLMIDLHKRGPPSLVNEYILHEVICTTVGHYRAIILQQQFFPEHYREGDYEEADGIKFLPNSVGSLDKPYKGIFSAFLKEFILTADFIRTIENYISYASKKVWEQRDEEALVSGTGRGVFEFIAGIFGIDKGNDDERHNEARKCLEAFYKLDRDKREEYFTEIKKMAPYFTWTASGKHRFMPLALAVINQMSGNNLFDVSILSRLKGTDLIFKKLTAISPVYDTRDSEAFVPQLQLIPHSAEKKNFRWLDIGSAPKRGGAPTLNLLDKSFRELLPDTLFEFVAVDLFYPLLQLSEDDKVVKSEYMFRDGIYNKENMTFVKSFFSDSPQYNPTHNIMDKEFDLGTFDYISLCMTLHHLRHEGELFREITLVKDFRLVDEMGLPYTRKYFLYQSQQDLLTRLFDSLNDNGVFFLTIVPGWHYINEVISFSDVFVVIQRKGDLFIVYENVLPFRPNKEPFTTEDYLFDPVVPTYQNRGIKGLYPGASDTWYKEVKSLLLEADKLAYRYQKLAHSIWARIWEVSQTIGMDPNTTITLGEIFSIYLQDVPDENERKASILHKAEMFHQNYAENGELLSRIIERFANQDTLSFVDLDTGTGEFVKDFSDLLLNHFKKVDGIGVEMLGELVRKAQQKGFTVVHGTADVEDDYEKVGLTDKSRDIVIINLIESRPLALIAQADRILKHNGMVLITFEKYDVELDKRHELIEQDLIQRGFHIERIPFPENYPRSVMVTEVGLEQADIILIAYKRDKIVLSKPVPEKTEKDKHVTFAFVSKKESVDEILRVYNKIWSHNPHVQLTYDQMKTLIDNRLVYLLKVNGRIKGVLLTYPLTTKGDISSTIENEQLWHRMTSGAVEQGDHDTILFWSIGTDPSMRGMKLGEQFLAFAKQYFENKYEYIGTYSPVLEQGYQKFIEEELRIKDVSEDIIKRYGIYLYLTSLRGKEGYRPYLDYIISNGYISPEHFFKIQDRKFKNNVENFHVLKGGAVITQVILFEKETTRPDGPYTVIYGYKGFRKTDRFRSLLNFLKEISFEKAYTILQLDKTLLLPPITVLRDILVTQRIPDEWSSLEALLKKGDIRKNAQKVARIGQVIEEGVRGFDFQDDCIELLIESVSIWNLQENSRRTTTQNKTMPHDGITQKILSILDEYSHQDIVIETIGLHLLMGYGYFLTDSGEIIEHEIGDMSFLMNRLKTEAGYIVIDLKNQSDEMVKELLAETLHFSDEEKSTMHEEAITSDRNDALILSGDTRDHTISYNESESTFTTRHYTIEDKTVFTLRANRSIKDALCKAVEYFMIDIDDFTYPVLLDIEILQNMGTVTLKEFVKKNKGKIAVKMRKTDKIEGLSDEDKDQLIQKWNEYTGLDPNNQMAILSEKGRLPGGSTAGVFRVKDPRDSQGVTQLVFLAQKIANMGISQAKNDREVNQHLIEILKGLYADGAIANELLDGLPLEKILADPEKYIFPEIKTDQLEEIERYFRIKEVVEVMA
ncbi:LOG family protein [Chlamydiota bacterium]